MGRVLVKDGEVVETELPEVGILPDGRHVSGFDKLDDNTLKDLGWLSVEDVGPPEFNPGTQVIERTLDVQEDKVVAVYSVNDVPSLPDVPEGSPDELAGLTARDLAAILLGKGLISYSEMVQILAAKNDTNP